MSHGSGAYTRAMRLWQEGVPVRDIADQCGVPYGTVMSWATGNRDEFPARRRCPRVTDEQREQAVAMRERGASYASIARELGFSVMTAVRICGQT